jgi:MFS family permease
MPHELQHSGYIMSMNTSAESPDSLFSFEFVALSAISFLAFCNLSLFYGFNAYLEGIGVSAVWRGVLIGLEPGTAFLLRPIISPWLTPRNSVRTMGIGLVLILVALLSYPLAPNLWPLALVRVLHGTGFVVMISACVSVLVLFIPPGRSGQGFGVFSISTLLPYAVLPPLVEPLLVVVGDASRVYALFTPLFVPVLLLLPAVGRGVRRRMADLPDKAVQRPRCTDLVEDLRTPGIARLLTANLLLFIATTTVFFYMKDHLSALGGGNPGLFFSISTGATILVRIACGKLLDKVNRAAMLGLFLLVLAMCFLLFSLAETPGNILILAGLYGVCLGFVMPQLNAAMFDISPRHLRGLNTNMMLFTMDAGFWMGPMLAGLLLAMGTSYAGLFLAFAVLPLTGSVITWSMVKMPRAQVNPSNATE